MIINHVFFKCVLAIVVVDNVLDGLSLASSKGFCLKYNCTCPGDPINDQEETVNGNRVRCRFDSSVRSVDFLDPSVSILDFSDSSSLEYVTFGDVGLNINQLILRNSTIRVIHEEAFVKLPHLHHLDLSRNKIDSFQEMAFSNVNVLASLNLSQSFVQGYKLTRELCELLGLEELDLSFANLDEFTLECWKSSHLKRLYLRHGVQVEKNWQNWFPFIGSQLELLDLSNSDMVHLDSSISSQAVLLSQLCVTGCVNLDHSSLFDLLNSNALISRLTRLEIAGLNASQNSIDLTQLFLNANANQTRLQHLDISCNRYSDDLNTVLFNQRALAELRWFSGRGNGFGKCNRKLIAGREQTLLARLEYLDLAENQIDASCLDSIRPIKTLTYLDISHNQVKLLASDLKANDLHEFFTDKLNLSYIDFSYNQLSVFEIYLSPEHAKPIQRIDFSHNQLKAFAFLSHTKYQSMKTATQEATASTKSATSIKTSAKQKNRLLKNDPDDVNNSDENSEEDDAFSYEQDYDEAYEDYKNAEEVLIEPHSRRDDWDDDVRYLVLERIDLSQNNLSVVFVQHMFQSVRNAGQIDLTGNPIQHLLGMTGDPLLVEKIVANGTKVASSSSSSQIIEAGIDLGLEALCIDHLDLTGCQLQRLPNLQHTCLNKLSLAYNQLSGSVHLVISNYSLYFLDYLDLQNNNVSHVKMLVSEQKFKQDRYPIQNSPFHYFYGSKASLTLSQSSSNSQAHTYIDLKRNPAFQCDCALYTFLNEFNKVKILNDCFNTELQNKCDNIASQDGSNSNGLSIRGLNQTLRILFILTCMVLVTLGALIVYYMFSDCIRKGNRHINKLNMSQMCGCMPRLRLFSRPFSSWYQPNIITSSSLSSTSGSISTSTQTKTVHYSKLINDDMSGSSTQIEIHS